MNAFRLLFIGKIFRSGLPLFLACAFLAAACFAQQTGRYAGSAESNKYHYATCRYVKRIKPENLVFFMSVKAAREKGYVPCKVCKPPSVDK